jgi:hypothetical protein
MEKVLWGMGVFTVALATGCDAGDGRDDSGLSSRAACVTPSGAGIVGLSDVTISGTADILGAHADVFANYDVSLAGNFLITGDAVSPTNVTIHGSSGTLTGMARIGGGFVSVSPPYAAAADAAVANDNAAIASHLSGDELRLSGTTEATVPGGVYYLDDGIRMAGQSKLRIEGDVVFYVNGPVSLSGNCEINTDGGAHRVELISISSDTISLSGTSDVVMNVFAPIAPVRLTGTTDFEGTVLGDSVVLSGNNGFRASGDAIAYDSTCTGSLPGLPHQPD